MVSLLSSGQKLRRFIRPHLSLLRCGVTTPADGSESPGRHISYYVCPFFFRLLACLLLLGFFFSIPVYQRNSLKRTRATNSRSLSHVHTRARRCTSESEEVRGCPGRHSACVCVCVCEFVCRFDRRAHRWYVGSFPASFGVMSVWVP